MSEKKFNNLNPKGKRRLALLAFLGLLMLALIGYAGVELFKNNNDGHEGLFSKMQRKHSAKKELVGAVDNFVGFGPIYLYNGGLETAEGSLLRKKFGDNFSLRFLITRDIAQQLALLNSGAADFTFATTDCLPSLMQLGETMDEMDMVVFLAVCDSRGGDIICVDESRISSLSQLRGKRIACAKNSPSNSLLYLATQPAGLSPNDYQIMDFGSSEDCANAYINNRSDLDACVVWSPDNQACVKKRRPTKQLITTREMAYAITDVLIAPRQVIEENPELFQNLVDSWCEANAIVQNEGRYEEAALAYLEALKSRDELSGTKFALMDFYYMTIGDNLNYFEINRKYSGVTGRLIYDKMSEYYDPGHSNPGHSKKTLEWDSVAYVKFIKSSSLDLNNSLNKPEGKVKFSSTSIDEEAIEKNQALSVDFTINFGYNDTILSFEQEMYVKENVGSLIKTYPRAIFIIEGNTDNTGSRAYNIKLSQARARAIVNCILKYYDIFDESQFITRGNGPDKPVASNGTEQGRYQNRRTDVKVLTNPPE